MTILVYMINFFFYLSKNYMKVLDVDIFYRRWSYWMLIMAMIGATFCIKSIQSLIVNVPNCNIDIKLEIPMFINLMMSLAMFTSFIVYLIMKKIYPNPNNPKNSFRDFLLLPVIAFADVFYTWVTGMCISKLGVSLGTISYLLSSSFVLLIRKYIFRKKIYKYELFSVIMMDIAVILYAISEYSNFGESIAKYYALFIVQIVSELVKSIEFILMESLVQNTGMACEFLVGATGGFGLLYNIFCFSPVLYFINDPPKYNFYENFCQNIVLLFTNKQVAFGCFTYYCCSCILNIFLVRNIYYTNALTTSITDGFSSIFIWLMEIVLYFIADFKAIAEIDKSGWVAMKAIAYLLIICSFLIFSRAIQFSFFEYPMPTNYIIPASEI